jgi:hypothetical protein
MTRRCVGGGPLGGRRKTRAAERRTARADRELIRATRRYDASTRIRHRAGMTRQSSDTTVQAGRPAVASVNFGIRLPVELIESADARAQLEDRTRTQVIRQALREDLAKPAHGEREPRGATHHRDVDGA